MKKTISIVLLVLICIMTFACKSIYNEVKMSTSTRYENGQYIKTATIKNITDKRLTLNVKITKEEYSIVFIPPHIWVKRIDNIFNENKEITLDPMEETRIETIDPENADTIIRLMYPDSKK